MTYVASSESVSTNDEIYWRIALVLVNTVAVGCTPVRSDNLLGNPGLQHLAHRKYPISCVCWFDNSSKKALTNFGDTTTERPGGQFLKKTKLMTHWFQDTGSVGK